MTVKIDSHKLFIFSKISNSVLTSFFEDRLWRNTEASSCFHCCSGRANKH